MKLNGADSRIIKIKDYLGWLSGNQIHFAKQTSVASEVMLNIFATPREVAVFDPLLQSNLQGKILFICI